MRMIRGAVDKATADTLIGTTIAQYEVVARLGGGGMGIVYSARDTKLGRRVALKFLPPRWSHDDSAKQRFIREAQAASATDHRNICTIHDIETAADGQLFIVMAHYDGPTLKQRLEAGPLPVDDAVEIAAQVAEGLAKAHAQGVIHRDIKPGNLILTEDGVKILDFGLAKLAAEALRLTLEGTTIGTVAYMSPEQARGDEADPRSDIWALGIVIYEMLAGQPPFRGHYAEAISHAIRHDTPAPLRAATSDVPEPLEQLVCRALEKNPADRVQSARDLARELRLLQGRTLPLDLRTEPLTAPRPGAGPAGHAARAFTARDTRFWTRPKAIGVTAAIVALLAGAPIWLFAPVDRVPIAVAPVINQTGYTELDPYRLALTLTLVDELRGSERIRVLPYDRLRQIVRRFQPPAGDVSSREALQALTMQSGARVIVVPTLLYENGGWKARVEFRDPGTAVNQATYETPQPIVSSLMKDTVYGLTASLATEIERHFLETGPRRAYVATMLRNAAGRGPVTAAASRLRTLDAAAAFERGLAAYEQQELADARQAFASAAELDPRNPLPLAWRSRVATLMRQDKDAGDAADQASRLITAQFPVSDRLFVEAVVAESRRDGATAEARYRDLASREPDAPLWATELAAFHDRQGKADDAIAGYHGALALDSRLARPHLELCRLYSPSRTNEPALAKEQGQMALEGYRALGNRGGEAQALWCLSDVLRAGSEADRREARRHADAALPIMQALGYRYGLARAYNYIGNVALLAERNGREAAALFEKALAGARDTGNRFLEPRLLMNLGVSNELFGQRAAAVNYYRDSFKLFEMMGSQQEAAWNQANAAGILIEYGGDVDQGLRDAQNALVVVQKVGDKVFEVFTRRLIAKHYRYAGKHAEALRELTLAQNIATERNLDYTVPRVSIDLAGVHFDTADYVVARQLLLNIDRSVSVHDDIHAQIELARIDTRLGRFEVAREGLAEATEAVQRNGDVGSLPLLHLAQGELAYESGRLEEARTQFVRASELWTDDLPEAASVEARAYVGLLDGRRGQLVKGRSAAVASLEQARRLRRVALEARCLLFLARIDVFAGRFDDAIDRLAQIPMKTEPSLGPELRAQIHYWRSRVRRARGERAMSAEEARQAVQHLDELRALIPESMRGGFSARPDIHAMTTANNIAGTR